MRKNNSERIIFTVNHEEIDITCYVNFSDICIRLDDKERNIY